jgi:general secretion pathway protein K
VGPHPKNTQRGAALLLALTLVALVATLASGMVWQQWRAVQVEAAERSRAQSLWILQGAIDWTRLILREDARGGGAVDHLGEPWATPLAEARLSSFLAADRDNAGDAELEAFLSGAIVDAQSRYNLRNLFDDQGRLLPGELPVLQRLCDAAGAGMACTTRLVDGLGSSWAREAGTSPSAGGSDAGGAASGSGATGGSGLGINRAADSRRPLPVTRLEHLAWLGLDAATLAALRPLAEVLPVRTQLNVNTASREVLAAVLGIDPGTAERLVARRQTQAFETLEQLRTELPSGTPLEASRVAVQTSFFEATGRIRIDERIVQERVLLQRKGRNEVAVLRRSRETLLASGAGF